MITADISGQGDRAAIEKWVQERESSGMMDHPEFKELYDRECFLLAVHMVALASICPFLEQVPAILKPFARGRDVVTGGRWHPTDAAHNRERAWNCMRNVDYDIIVCMGTEQDPAIYCIPHYSTWTMSHLPMAKAWGAFRRDLSTSDKGCVDTDTVAAILLAGQKAKRSMCSALSSDNICTICGILQDMYRRDMDFRMFMPDE
jgi:hypothetical protein